MKITAFKVKGDSFLLEKRKNGRKVKILIDGGEERKFDKLIRSYLGKKKKLNLDLIVCTHLDSDHSIGLISLLRSKGVLKSCKEIWLPVLWADTIIKMLKNDSNYIKKLLNVIKSQSKSFDDLDEIMQEVEVNEEDDEPYLLSEIKDVPLLSFNNLTFIDFFIGMLESGDREVWDLLFFLTDNEFDSLMLTFKKLKRLTEIIYELKVRSIPIVWLDLKQKEYSEWENDNRLLIPLCHEVLVGYRKKVNYSSIFCLIPQPRLSEINRRSLVIASKESNGQLAIFSADSNFEHISQNQLNALVENNAENGIMVTVPHHGSHSSSDAILKINNSVIKHGKKKNVKWIRGNNPSSFTMSPHFFKLKGSRYCLNCFIWSSAGKKLATTSKKQKKRNQKKNYITLSINNSNKLRKCVCKSNP